MGIRDLFKNNEQTISTEYKMIVDNGSGFYSFGNNLYKSDIIRSAIRPKARAIGKAIPKHVRETDGKQVINPDMYMKMLLQEPNPLMTWQMLTAKMMTHLELNHNAFALIIRDENGLPVEEYPLTPTSVLALKDAQGNLYLKFILKDGKPYTFKYSDIIHLRKDFNSNEIFGDSPVETLIPLMEVISTTDQGIIQAIKNSAVIRWLLKFKSTTRPEEIKKRTKEFTDMFLQTEGESTGAAGVDQSLDAQQVEPKNYVPNAAQMDRTKDRILSFFNTNEKIVKSNYSENEWISYYESNCEPDIKQSADEHTRKCFTRRQRGFGNSIIFDSSDLAYASMNTKLDLVQLVDRELMSVEEFRKVFGFGPKKSTDTFMRRLDTARTNDSGGKGGEQT